MARCENCKYLGATGYINKGTIQFCFKNNKEVLDTNTKKISVDILIINVLVEEYLEKENADIIDEQMEVLDNKILGGKCNE